MKGSMNYVVDSSVAVKWLSQNNELHLNKAISILDAIALKKAVLFEPELVKYEVFNALINKKLTPDEIDLALFSFFTVPIYYCQLDKNIIARIMEIATKFSITFYDASFIALAEEKKAVLVTDNPKHQKVKVKGLKVVTLKDYR